jgi:hypothetical protein
MFPPVEAMGDHRHEVRSHLIVGLQPQDQPGQILGTFPSQYSNTTVESEALISIRSYLSSSQEVMTVSLKSGIINKSVVCLL